MNSKSRHKSLSIGIGGNIGSGKTTVVKEFARLFQKDGYKVVIIDADRLAWKIYLKGTSVFKKIVSDFGAKILSRNGEIDRPKLSQIVFFNKAKLQQLNRIVHPQLIKTIKSELQKQNAQVKILDAALLFDWAKKIPMNYRILVTAPNQQKVKRMIKRGYNLIQVKNRLQQQMKESEMEKVADFVINNDHTISELKKKVNFLYNEILSTINL